MRKLIHQDFTTTNYDLAVHVAFVVTAEGEPEYIQALSEFLRKKAIDISQSAAVEGWKEIAEFEHAANSESEDEAVRGNLGPKHLESIDQFVKGYVECGWLSHERGVQDLRHYLQLQIDRLIASGELKLPARVVVQRLAEGIVRVTFRINKQ